MTIPVNQSKIKTETKLIFSSWITWEHLDTRERCKWSFILTCNHLTKRYNAYIAAVHLKRASKESNNKKQITWGGPLLNLLAARRRAFSKASLAPNCSRKPSFCIWKFKHVMRNRIFLLRVCDQIFVDLFIYLLEGILDQTIVIK